MIRCLYCAKEKKADEFSLEHIWPSALGGALLPNLFKTRAVCERCNNFCGLFVDGGFVKSWFVQAELAMNGHEFLDPQRPASAPLIYFGEEKGVPVTDGEICERWAGLSGDRIYHFHKRDDEKWHGLAGGDIIKRKKRDPGRAYIAFGSAHEYWYTSAALSFYRHFEKAKRCVLNGQVAPEFDARLASIIYPAPDPNDVQQLQDIDALRGVLKSSNASTTIPVQVGFDIRFLCKVALGIGSNILGEAYERGAYADELRKGLWSRTPEERKGLKIRGSGFISDGDFELSDDIRGFMSINGTWSICVWKHGNWLAAHIHSPRRKHMSIIIEDDCDAYDQTILEGYEEGVLYFVSPYRGLMVGPIGLNQVLAHKLSEIYVVELAGIDLAMTSLSILPPKR